MSGIAKPLINGCEVCGKNDRQNVMLICDDCEKEFHTDCIGMPGLPPANANWYCDDCVNSIITDQFHRIEVTPTEQTSSSQGSSSNPISLVDYPDDSDEGASPSGLANHPTRITTTQTSPVSNQPITTTQTSPVSNQPTTITIAHFDKGANVWIYIRVSTEEQDDPGHGRFGPVTQNRVVTKFCTDRVHDIQQIIREHGSARDITKLPKHRKLVDDLPPKSLIVVYSVSRFGRNAAQVRELIDRLHKKECAVYAVSEDVYSTDPRFVRLSELAEQELVMMIQRQKDTRERQTALLEPGETLGRGRAPYGKKRLRNARNIMVSVDDPDEQAVIRFIVASRDCRTDKIIRALVRGGYPKCRGTPWTDKAIKTIIRKHAPKRPRAAPSGLPMTVETATQTITRNPTTGQWSRTYGAAARDRRNKNQSI